MAHVIRGFVLRARVDHILLVLLVSRVFSKSLKDASYVDIQNLSYYVKHTLGDLIRYGKCEGADYFNGQESYRLGDAISGDAARVREPKFEEDHRIRFPNSLATEYMALVPAGKQSLKILASLINKRHDQISLSPLAHDKLPAPDELVVHLRIGDVIDYDKHSVENILVFPVYFHEERFELAPWHQYVKPLAYYRSALNLLHLSNLSFSKVTLVASSHHQQSSYLKSCLYISVVKSFFESTGFFESVRLRTGQFPDDDAIFMSSASFFLPSGGGFSRWLAHIVEVNGGTVIWPQGWVVHR
jgi:hypothetical protein